MMMMSSRQLGPPWDLPFHRYLLTFSWKSSKPLLSAAPTSNPACGSAMWMIQWYICGMATWQRRTSGLLTTPQRATLQHQVYDGSRRRRQDPVPWCWHLQKSWWLLAPQIIQVYHSAPNKLQGLLHTHKDKPDPSNRAGVYRIPCECGKVYIGETGQNLPTRLKEHRAHGCRGDFEKSSIVKHSYIKDHQIDRQAAQLITPINSWHTRHIREAIKIFKHDTVPQDIGFFIIDIWLPLLRTEGSEGYPTS